MDKKKVTATALKVATGYHAVTRTISGIMESGSRIRSLPGLLKRGEFNRTQGKYIVYSPYIYQYGKYESDKYGEDVFIPEGVAFDKESALEMRNEGKVVLKGGYFFGDDFPQLIINTFSGKQIREMIEGARVRKLIVVVGAVTILVVAFMFAVAGHLYALSSLPLAFMLFAFAVKYGAYAETLRTLRPHDLRDYFAARGIIKGIFG